MRRTAILSLVLAVAAAGALSLTMAPNSAPRADDTPAAKPGIGVATLGSGCFWCTEKDFDALPGILSTVSGYMGGPSTTNATYEQVSTGRTGHVEVLQVTFDTTKVTYEQVLHHFWRTTDVVDGGGQFCDRGNQYRPAIFAHGADQLKLAQDGKAASRSLLKSARPRPLSRPRTTIRTSTRKIRAAISATAPVAAVTPASTRCGARIASNISSRRRTEAESSVGRLPRKAHERDPARYPLLGRCTQGGAGYPRADDQAVL